MLKYKYGWNIDLFIVQNLKSSNQIFTWSMTNSQENGSILKDKDVFLMPKQVLVSTQVLPMPFSPFALVHRVLSTDNFTKKFQILWLLYSLISKKYDAAIGRPRFYEVHVFSFKMTCQ